MEKIETLSQELGQFQPWHAARAHALAKLARNDEARGAYEDAIKRSQNIANSNFLNTKLYQLGTH